MTIIMGNVVYRSSSSSQSQGTLPQHVWEGFRQQGGIKLASEKNKTSEGATHCSPVQIFYAVNANLLSYHV
ncbi:MAG TPA: hypothetical protein VIW25_15855 [Nitrososphaeraceae archaeon]